jgi:hypothetical protein
MQAASAITDTATKTLVGHMFCMYLGAAPFDGHVLQTLP